MGVQNSNTTDRPLDSNHPSSPNNLAVLPHGPEGIPRISESQFKTVGYLRMRRGVRRLTLPPERLEVFERGGVLIGWVAEHDDIQRLRVWSLRSWGLGR